MLTSPARFPFVELRLKNFRGFENARLALSDLTILVGPNGVGKSTLVEGFDFMREAVSDSLLVALERRGGLAGIRRKRPGKGNRSDVTVAVVFQWAGNLVLYGFRLGPLGSGAGYSVREELLRYDQPHLDWFHREGDSWSSNLPIKPVLDPESLLLPVLAGQSSLWAPVLHQLRHVGAFAFSTDQLRAEPPVGGGEAMHRSGSNLGDVLQHIWKANGRRSDWVSSHLQAIVPELAGVQPTSGGGRRLIRFEQFADGQRQKTNHFYSGAMSVGTLKSLAILAALQQPQIPSLVAVEDIEDSIHPAALGVIMDAVASCLGDFPVVLTTHSPEFLSLPAARAERIRLVVRKDGASWVHRLAPQLHSLPAYETVGGLLRVNGLIPAGAPDTVDDCFSLEP